MAEVILGNDSDINVTTRNEEQISTNLNPERAINTSLGDSGNVSSNLPDNSTLNISVNNVGDISSNVVVGETINATLPDINYIPDYEIAERQRRENEAQRIAYYTEIQEKVNNGDFDGADGFSPIITTSKEGKETTITIIDAEGTKTATILDGDDATDKNFTFVQNVATDTWVITHNLGKYPSVSVIDSSGEEVVGEISYDSLNQITIKFGGGFKGTASLN